MLINNFLLKNKLNNINFNFKYLYISLSGFFSLACLTTILNFFFSLNIYLNSTLAIIALISLVYLCKSDIKKILIYNFVATIITSILIFASTHHNDFSMYHLPYIKILNENNTIIGLANLHFRFGHTSILQNLSAAYVFPILPKETLLIPISYLYVVTIIFNLIFLRDEKNFKLTPFSYFFSFALTVFCLIKFSRFSGFGNDISAHILVLNLFFFTIFLLEKINKKETNLDYNFFLIIFFIICSLIPQTKPWLIVTFLVPLVLIKYLKYFNTKELYKFLIAGFFVLSIFGFNNFLKSSCFIYPLEVTCIKTSWYPKDKTHADVAVRHSQGEAWSKGWPDQKKIINHDYENFNKNFSWLKTWKKVHFKKVRDITIGFLVVLMSLLFIIGSKKKNNLNLSPFNSLLIISIILSLIWFIKFPLLRYGTSLLIANISLICLYISFKYLSFNLKKSYTYSNFLLIICLIFFVGKNLNRIAYAKPYDRYPWPKIYSEDNKKPKFEFRKFENFKIYYRAKNDDDLVQCWYNVSPCTHFMDFLNEIEYEKNYLFHKIKIK